MSDFALVGAPEAVVGVVKVSNTTAVTQTVTEVLVRDPDGKLADIPLSVVSKDIDSGSTVDVSVGLRMLPDTAPGEYPIHLVVLDNTYVGTAYVTDRVVAAISPAKLVVLNSTKKQKHRVVVSNQGNVDLQIHAPSGVALYRERDVTVDAVRILSGTADTDDAGQAPGVPSPSGTLDVGIAKTPVSVPPGGVVALDLTLSIQKGADQSIRHVAEVPLSVADLIVLVTPAP